MIRTLLTSLETGLLRVLVRIRTSGLIQSVRDLMRVLRPIRFVCFMVLIGGFALLTFDQLSEILRIMMTEDFWPARIVFLLAFSGWAYASWFSARFSLDACCLYDDLLSRKKTSISRIEKTVSHRRIVFLMAFIPRLLGLLCHGIILVAFHKVEPWSMEVFLYAGLTFLYLIFVFFRRETQAIRSGTFSFRNLFRYSALKKRFNPCEIYGWERLTSAERRLIRTTLGISGSIFLLAVVIPRSWQLAFYEQTTLVASDYSDRQFLNTLILVLVSLFVWLTLGMYLQRLARKANIRLFSTLLIFTMLFSFLNNNHLVRTTPDTLPPIAARSSLPDYFDAWYQRKQPQWALTHPSDTMPVFILAAEGGGSRAAYWTAMALEKLYQRYGEAFEYTFAISSVSGGSLGAAMYLSYRHDTGGSQLKDSVLARMVSKDFLTPLTSALLYPELIQKTLPIPITYFDRARWLEDSWALVYETTLNRTTWDQPFLSLWQSPQGDTLPLLFLNSTKVETGQKILLSPVRAEDTYFKDAVDLLEVSGRDFPLKTAVSLSARFPLVTPSGRIHSYRPVADSIWGHVVDGGYFENTGLGTATEIYLFLDYQRIEKKYKIRPILISIANDDYSLSDDVFRFRFLYEIQTPLSAFYNAWGRRSAGTNFIARQFVGNPNFMGIDLNRKTARVPLNWYISPASVDSMQSQLNRYDFSKVEGWLQK